MCLVLHVSRSAYRHHASRLRDPARASLRAMRDEALALRVRHVWQENYEVYGARKVWRQLLCEGQAVAHCAVERLMRAMRLRDVTLGRLLKPRKHSLNRPILGIW
ncbi:IS3 family transposase [Pseudomonas sp. REB1044]|uniref:IS3 family transposase n=1 Tax=Pseudomonas sp. REB1044 TaxID=2675224 RepID=UPI003368663F